MLRKLFGSHDQRGVDSKTKTDKNDGSHTKDLQKVSAFVKAARTPMKRDIEMSVRICIVCGSLIRMLDPFFERGSSVTCPAEFIKREKTVD